MAGSTTWSLAQLAALIQVHPSCRTGIQYDLGTTSILYVQPRINMVLETCKDLVNLVKFLLCLLYPRLVNRLYSRLFRYGSCVTDLLAEEIKYTIIYTICRMTWRGRNPHLQRSFHFQAQVFDNRCRGVDWFTPRDRLSRVFRWSVMINV